AVCGPRPEALLDPHGQEGPHVAGPEPAARVARRELDEGKRADLRAPLGLLHEPVFGTQLHVAEAPRRRTAFWIRVAERDNEVQLEARGRAVVALEVRRVAGAIATFGRARARKVELPVVERDRLGRVPRVGPPRPHRPPQ